MRVLGGVRKSIDQSWSAKGLGLGLLCWGFKGVQEDISREDPALFKPGQWDFHQDSAPVYNSILVTDYLAKMGIQTVPQPSYSPDVAPCDFWLFPKLRGCSYEDFHGALQMLLERYNRCIASGGYYFEGD